MRNDSSIIAFWSPFQVAASDFYLDFFGDNLKKYNDIQCIDCSRIAAGKRCYRILEQMDLVVVALPQNRRLLDRYFCEHRCWFSNVIYMLPNYFGCESLSAERICWLYRIPKDRLLCVPYNVRYREAAERGRTHEYFQSTGAFHMAYDEYTGFWNALYHSALHLVRAVEHRN